MILRIESILPPFHSRPQFANWGHPLPGRGFCGFAAENAYINRLTALGHTTQGGFFCHPSSGTSTNSITFLSEESVSKTIISFSPVFSMGAGQYRVFWGPASL